METAGRRKKSVSSPLEFIVLTMLSFLSYSCSKIEMALTLKKKKFLMVIFQFHL